MGSRLAGPRGLLRRLPEKGLTQDTAYKHQRKPFSNDHEFPKVKAGFRGPAEFCGVEGSRAVLSQCKSLEPVKHGIHHRHLQRGNYGHMDVVRMLVERGANLVMTDPLWKGTAVDWARHAGNS